jgi:ribosomal protein RSM22 (predicted rRNA methylase)
MLILIEPGTPAGFANIIEARSSILDYEGRRAAKLQKRISTASSDPATPTETLDDKPLTDSSIDSSSSRDDAMTLKASSKWFGAHVVAPCPHDAPCPLAQPGSKAWCHFGTRFQRPGFMQQAKALPGARMNPADHQDERYSYVVLR